VRELINAGLECGSGFEGLAMAFCSHDFGIRKFRFTGCKLFVPEPEPEPAAKDPLVAVVSLLLPMNMEDIPEGSLARTEFEAAFVLDLATAAGCEVGTVQAVQLRSCAQHDRSCI
jgi:hypothetical protein